MTTRFPRIASYLIGALAAASTAALAQTPPLATSGVVSTSTTPTAEVSTTELVGLLAAPGTYVFDARPTAEFAVSHIPGALNVAQKPGTDLAEYISDAHEIDRLVGGVKTAPIVLYCNGPFCGKSKRLAVDLQAMGYSNLKRYQLGAPTWRALTSRARLDSETKVSGQSRSCSACLETGRGRCSSSVSSRRRALGGRSTAPASRWSCRMSESNMQSPKRTLMVGTRTKEGNRRSSERLRGRWRPF